MKKGIIGLVFLLLCCAIQANATTYYGCADQEITAADTFKVDAACTGASLTWASLANGDVLVANNHAITIANDIGSVSVTATLTTAGNGGTDGGSYTFNINTTDAKTLYVNTIAGTTPALVVTGAGAGADTTELTIIGDITGGPSSGAYGVRLEHTSGMILITGDALGGSNTHAIHSASAGKFALTGDSTGVVGNGINSTSTAIFTVSGNCVGSAAGAGIGCACNIGTGYCTVTGNLINGGTQVAVTGHVRWTPTAPSSGVTGHYIKFDGGRTAGQIQSPPKI